MKKSDEITLAKKAYMRIWRAENPDKDKEYRSKNPEKARAWQKAHYAENHEHKKGCKFSESHSYLSLYGADWGCWGVDSSKGGKGFDIDHVVPISSATNETELLTVLHFTNLQILNSYENRFVKRNKLNYQPIK